MGSLGQAVVAVIMASAQLPPGAARPPEPRRDSCLSNPETRDAMQAHKIVPPYRAVAAAMREGGDLVGIRLCHAADPPLVYDVSVLRHDGRLVHVLVDAVSGTALPGRRDP